MLINDNDICIEVYNSNEWLKIYTKENQHRNYIQELLSWMTNSEIAEMIIWKRKELKLYPAENEWYKVDIVNNINLITLLINRLNFEIRQRDPDTKTENTKEFLDQKKREVSIVDVIQSVTGKHIDQSLSRNIKCPLPWHNDKTGSFHIYPHSNTFKCFGCQRWGSQVDFIKEMNQCSIWQAIKLFLTF